MLWSGTVSADSPLSFEAPFDLRITGACLGKGSKEGERVFLVMTHEDLVGEEPRSSPVCALSQGFAENVHLDLVLDEGEPVSFATAGSGDVHLTGYFVVEDDGEDDMMNPYGDMFEEDSEDETFDGSNIDEDSEDSEDDEPRVEEMEDEEIDNSILEKVRQKQAEAAKQALKDKSKKRKTPPHESTPPPAKKQKVESPMKVDTPTKSPQKEKPQSPSRVQKLRGGTVAEIMKPGKGSQGARPGQKITLKYEGRLVKNQKKFDAGKFSFKLGKGEVIKGMDVGVEGMLMNETRKLTIPFSQAYGNQGTNGIPPKSDLQFVVTVLNMK